jgi:competence protein ComGC
MRNTIQARFGATLVEVLVVIAVISILAALLLPTLSRAKARGLRAACLNNQKQIGLAFTLWAADHEEKFSSTVDVSDGGSRTRLETWQHFITMSNELVTPKILHCPSDRLKQTATDFSDSATGLRTFKNAAISYVVGTGAGPDRPSLHLAADRNLFGRDGQGCGPAAIFGFITQLRATNNPRWDKTIHINAGNVVLADGSAHQFTQTRLAEHMASTDDDPNCSLKPN